MKKSLNLLALVSAAVLLVGICSGRIYARLTGTNPGTDVWCVGASALEVCVDASGNILPTTTNIGSLGTSALKFKDLYLAGNASVAGTMAITGATTQTGSLSVGAGGNLFKVPVATQTVAAAATIDVTGACGGLLRLTTTNGSVTTNTTDTFTAPTSANTGCVLYVVNVSPNGAITLDDNAHFDVPNNVVLGTNDGAVIVQGSVSWILLGTSDN